MVLHSHSAELCYRKAWPVYGVRPQRERVSVIESQTSCCKRALNTTIVFNQQRPASTAAWAVNDDRRGNEVTPWYVIFIF